MTGENSHIASSYQCKGNNSWEASLYFDLCIDSVSTVLRPTQSSLNHLLELTFLVPVASSQDLARITGYVAWLCYVMGWPSFLASLIPYRCVYRVLKFLTLDLLRRPRLLCPLLSRPLFTDATPSSIAAVAVGPPRASMVQHYTDCRQIAIPEMAAALRGLLWLMRTQVSSPTNITLWADSSVVCHTLTSGTGLTLRSSAMLQQVFVQMYY